MLVLAFDTATAAVTVAVGTEERVLAHQTTVDARRQGAPAYPGLLGDPIAPRYPSAATAVLLRAKRLARGNPLPAAEPLYLRRPDARVPGAPKSVLAGPATRRAASGAVPP